MCCSTFDHVRKKQTHFTQLHLKRINNPKSFYIKRHSGVGAAYTSQGIKLSPFQQQTLRIINNKETVYLLIIITKFNSCLCQTLFSKEQRSFQLDIDCSSMQQRVCFFRFCTQFPYTYFTCRKRENYRSVNKEEIEIKTVYVDRPEAFAF